MGRAEKMMEADGCILGTPGVPPERGVNPGGDRRFSETAFGGAGARSPGRSIPAITRNKDPKRRSDSRRDVTIPNPDE
jgi:hypothetical protein